MRFGAGDLVLVPHGSAHVLCDPPERASVPLDRVLAESGFDAGGPLAYGGDGARTVLVCGHFAFADVQPLPLVDALPPLLHLRAEAGDGYGWMDQVVRRMERETRSRAIGHGEVVRRLSEILLVEVLRAHAACGDAAALSCLGDPHLARALEAIHERPEAGWTLAALARAAGQSRTLFAERFRARMGVSPMKYLARWRLLRARRLLAQGGLSVSEVARRSGWVSESAFHRAFREEFGASPGRWRRLRDAA